MADYTKVTGVAAADIVKIDGVAIADVEKVDGATKPSAAAYDWTFSLFDETTIADHTTFHNDPDQWSGGGGNYRAPNTQNYRVTCVPYVDDSSGTATLKLASIGHAGHSADDFNEVDTGIQAASGNNHLVALSTTGVTFSGGNMVDGDHVIKWQHRHDAKTDTYYSVTAVLECASNVLTAYAHYTNHSSSYQAYVTAATAKSSGDLRWQITWNSGTNTWTVNTSDDDWQQSNNSNVSITTSGGTVGKYTTQYSIIGSSPADGRMWEITVG